VQLKEETQMRERLWTEIRLPLEFKRRATRWIPDEDIFLLPQQQIEQFFNVIALCEFMQLPHQFLVWTHQHHQQVSVLAKLEATYVNLCQQPNAVMLFSYPPPATVFEVWDHLALFPKMTVERQHWLAHLASGDAVWLMQCDRTETLPTPTLTQITRAGTRSICVASHWRIDRRRGYHRQPETERAYWIEPCKAEANKDAC